MYKLNHPIQLGILGCGSFVQRRILPILKEIDSIEVLALQKRNIKEAEKIASKWNILVQKDKLSGVIDFGEMAVGDPSCDLGVAWTFLKGNSRKIFKSSLALDEKTWNRARGWAL